MAPSSAGRARLRECLSAQRELRPREPPQAFRRTTTSKAIRASGVTVSATPTRMAWPIASSRRADLAKLLVGALLGELRADGARGLPGDLLGHYNPAPVRESRHHEPDVDGDTLLDGETIKITTTTSHRRAVRGRIRPRQATGIRSSTGGRRYPSILRAGATGSSMIQSVGAQPDSRTARTTPPSRELLLKGAPDPLSRLGALCPALRNRRRVPRSGLTTIVEGLPAGLG